MTKTPDNNPEFDEELKSKTQLKKEAHDLLALGLKLANLSKHQQAKIPMTDDLRDALALAGRIKGKHEAFRRHGQYMGKLLREEDVDAIYQALDLLSNKHQQLDKKYQQYETLRDNLLSNGDDEIQSLIEQHSRLERQKLRQLVRQAKKEVEQEKPAKSFAALFDYLREHVAL